MGPRHPFCPRGDTPGEIHEALWAVMTPGDPEIKQVTRFQDGAGWVKGGRSKESKATGNGRAGDIRTNHLDGVQMSFLGCLTEHVCGGLGFLLLSPSCL